MQNNYKQKNFSLDECANIAFQLMPDRRITRKHNEVRVGNKDSLSLKEPGKYYDHEIGQGGSVIDLVMRIKSCDFKAALSWCKEVANLSCERDGQSTDRPKCATDKERTARALKIWCETKSLKGTIGEQYFKNRGITRDLPDSLRFKEHMWHPSGKRYPAVIARVCNDDKCFIAVHVIYIDPSTAHKISDAQAKLSFGPISCGAVRLSTLKERLVITEGIEDGLSLLQADPTLSVWACLGTSGLRNVEIPQSVREVVIAADNDEAGWSVALLKKSKLQKAGYVVHIHSPKNCKDYNELLCRGRNVS